MTQGVDQRRAQYQEESSLISIVVPAHNVAPYITQCVNSMLNQTYKSIEVVVVDDCSTDGTGDVLDALARHDARLRVIHLEVNGGVHNARKVGLANAKGRYIGFVDSDDYVASNMYSRLMEALSRARSDICICAAVRVAEAGNAIGYKVHFSEEASFEHSLLDKFCRLAFGSGVLWNKVFRRELVESAFSCPIDPAIGAGAEDYILNMVAIDGARRICVIPDHLYFYRENPGSITQSGSHATAFAHALRAYIVALEVFKDAGEDKMRSIDSLYGRLLRYYPVSSNDKNLENVRSYMAESLRKLASLRPESVSALLNQDMEAHPIPLARRALSKSIRSARKIFASAVGRGRQ
jgi:glycosyltransferase involved in cell wall biosynthesis